MGLRCARAWWRATRALRNVVCGSSRKHGAVSCRCCQRRPAEQDEGDCGRNQHESAADQQRHVQAVDEGAVRERMGSTAKLLRDDAALSAAHVLDDAGSTCLG